MTGRIGAATRSSWQRAARGLALLCTGLCFTSCVFEFEERAQRPHGSVGAEMFRVVCMNLAAQSFPNDLTGERFTARCEGLDATPFTEVTPKGELEQRALLRFNALLARRKVLVTALEAVFGSEVFADDELRSFLGNLIPLYDAPELFPRVTREAAQLLGELIREDDRVSNDAVAALERMAAREGYRPLRLALGVTRPALEYPGLDAVVTSTLESVDPAAGPARAEWQALLRAAALDLATADATPPDLDQPGTLAVARDLLLLHDDAAFAGGRGSLFLTRRDPRGLARPLLVGGQLPAPFMDGDGDLVADIDARGRLRVSHGKLATPFRALSAALLGLEDAQRDARGRPFNLAIEPFDVCSGDAPLAGCGAACGTDSACGDHLACVEGACVWDEKPPLLFEYLDADRTLLAALSRDIGPLLVPEKALSTAALHDFAYGLNAVLGDQSMQSVEMGGAKLAFLGPDTRTGPIFDVVYALGHLMPFEETDQLLRTFEALVRDHERALAGLIEAILYIDHRADAHPDARWEAPHDFWDDLIAWTQRAMNRPEMLEALLRAMTSDYNEKAGPLIGNFMRFKDRVTYPQGTQEALEALGIDMKQVAGRPITNDAISSAVAEHRLQVNYPCPNPPTAFIGGPGDSAPGCLPLVPYPASNHKGIRDCPAQKPPHGTSCAAVSGYGLCSWDAGSCTCDCAGGLCRGDMTPTWQCTDLPTPGYASWVDRGAPDSRAGDGGTNQSLFQRTAALVHDLHGPAKLCNKAGARMQLYDPAGSNDKPALDFILSGLLGDLLGPYEACALLNETQIVQFFAQSILGTAVLKLQNEQLDETLDNLLPLLGKNKSELMEAQAQIRGLFVEQPTPHAVARMVFSPFNAFEDGLLALPTTRDGELIVDLHRDTIFAWELRDPVSGASYYEALKPLLQAFDEHEARDGTGNLTDGYLFGDLISIVHRHWSSRASDATQRDSETAPRFAHQSNGVSYEELTAEALIDARLLSRIGDVTRALDAIEVAPGVDGIDVLVTVTRNLLDPTKSCLGGDCTSDPLRHRDGRTGSTTNTGKPVALTPAHLLFDALNAMDRRFEGPMEARLAPWRAARSQLVDMLLEVERDAPGEWHFQNPHTQATLLRVSRFLRDRLAVYGAEQARCLADGGSASDCRQVRDWAVGLSARLATSLGQPVSAATFNLLERFWGAEGDPGGELLEMVHWLSQAESGVDKDAAIDSTLLAATDMLQLFEDTKNTAPVMRFLARALAPSALEVAGGKGPALDVENGAVEKALELMREVKKLDPAPAGAQSTLTKLMHELVKEMGPDGATPLEVILDTIGEVNRAAPGKDMGAPLDAADLRAVLRESSDFLSSERHGLERLYDIIQARELK
jgi:hypothetical protein